MGLEYFHIGSYKDYEKLSYDKLHKLVYANYSMKERIQDKSAEHKKLDMCSVMLDAALFDKTNPIWDLLDKFMNDVGPSLDDLYPSQMDKSACGRNG